MMRLLIDEDTAVQIIEPLLVMQELEGASGQRLVQIASIDPRRRFEITDRIRRCYPGPDRGKTASPHVVI